LTFDEFYFKLPTAIKEFIEDHNVKYVLRLAFEAGQQSEQGKVVGRLYQKEKK
jgi:hypothetical protein